MEIVDDGASREDLKLRMETKYAVPQADVGAIQNLLAQNCRRITHGASQHSTVRSIYFDNWNMKACRDNIDGIANRQKIRLRWYDRLKPQNEFFFEIKWRRNRLTGKHRLGISSGEPLSEMPYRHIVSALADILPGGFRERLLLNDEQKVLVEYKRQHFISRDSATRITIDSDLVFYDQRGKRTPSTQFGVPMSGFAVLEIKSAAKHRSILEHKRHIRGILYPLLPRATRCSKYVHGCRVLGMAEAAASFA